MHLARFPRIRLAHLPTPLEPLPRLSEALGVEIWIKRDDCTGLAGGGNKTRKLEFLLGDAFECGADTLVTQGAVQSNHVRQTAAAAAAHGLACEVILEERTGSKAVDYTRNGNVLMDRLFGAGIRTVPGGSDMPAELEKTAEAVRARGGRPYIIPGGGSNPVGALGYVDCAREIVVQADELDMPIDRIITATGSAGTHAGLVAGLAVQWMTSAVGMGNRGAGIVSASSLDNVANQILIDLAASVCSSGKGGDGETKAGHCQHCVPAASHLLAAPGDEGVMPLALGVPIGLALQSQILPPSRRQPGDGPSRAPPSHA